MDIIAAAETMAKGQPRVEALLAGLLASGRLPQALIFAGPEGSGKELMAMRLAAALECEALGPEAGGAEERGGKNRAPGPGAANAGERGGEARAGAPCGVCPSCVKARNLEHPDIHLVYPVPPAEWEKDARELLESRRKDFYATGEFGRRARSVGIGLVRSIIEALSKHPFEGRRSVVLIFEAHLATTEAQNALLRLLEEPPPPAVIILVTELSDRLLPTILSRCYEIRFESLGEEAVAGFLERFYSVEREEARRIAVLARGNLRRGIRFLDERFLNLTRDASAAMKLVLDGKERELAGEAEALAREYGGREEAGELLEEAAIIVSLLIRNREGLATEAERRLLERTLDAERLAAASRRDLPGDMRKISRSMESLRRNADVELTLSQLLLDLAGKWY